jgi:hypothetical protein
MAAARKGPAEATLAREGYVIWKTGQSDELFELVERHLGTPGVPVSAAPLLLGEA